MSLSYAKPIRWSEAGSPRSRCGGSKGMTRSGAMAVK